MNVALPVWLLRAVCASIVAKLQGSGNNLVSPIVEDLEELTSKIRSQAKEKVISASPKIDPSVSVINECFKRFENLITDLNTECKWNKYLAQKWFMCRNLFYWRERASKPDTCSQPKVGAKLYFLGCIWTTDKCQNTGKPGPDEPGYDTVCQIARDNLDAHSSWF